MKCPVCDGKGYFPVSNITAKVCPQCNGTGEVEQTNEEWMRTCSTEELATVIYGIAMYDTLYDRIHNAFVLNPCEDDSAGVNEVMEWLKEKHNA